MWFWIVFIVMLIVACLVPEIIFVVVLAYLATCLLMGVSPL
jgi:hypothetical protein